MRKLCCEAEGPQQLGGCGNRLWVPGEEDAKGAQVQAQVRVQLQAQLQAQARARAEGQGQAQAAASAVLEMAH